MDDWSFPSGTRLWKEFAVEGAPIETRMFAKLGPTDDDWVAVSYQWTADGSDAIAVPWGAFDVRAGHDIPGAGECAACHGGRKSRILGFSAIQLAAPAQPGEVGLAELVDRRLVSAPPAAPLTIPGDDTARAALGYLAANCGHCHNQHRPVHPGARCFDPENDYDFTLPVGALATVVDTPAYRTAIGHAVMPGDPDGSKLIALVSHRGFQRQMPPLATEHVDADAVVLLRRWIEGL
jgi:hypothetical protein